jgi:nucleoid-associated protein YgaU
MASRQFLAGDSLAGLAYEEYGDPNFWRAIAEINGIDDPMRVTPGRHLFIPSATEAATSVP